jgi:superfamily II DNA/RNA helicase
LDAGLAIGGSDILSNANMVQRNPEVIMGTPGRLVDLIKNTQFFDLSNIDILVVDEADRLFQMGFKNELDVILDSLSGKHNSMLFSATLNKEIKDLARANMKDPIVVDLLGLNIIPERIQQKYMFIDKKKATKFERIPFL